MRTARTIAAGILAASTLSVFAGAAAAQDAADTTVTGTIAESISISSAPATAVNMTLASTGANTASGGTIEVTANADYTLTVQGDKNAMTSWDGSVYDDITTLGSSMTVTPVLDSGVGVPVAAIVSTAEEIIATSVGLTTDTYSLTLAQPTTVADAPGTYRIVLTYTASPTL